MKALWQSLKSLYGIVSALTLAIGTVGVFGISVVVPSAPPWVSALIFAVSFIAGFLYGSFGAEKRSEVEAKKAYETERARIETEAAEKRRDLASIADAERKAKEDRNNRSFRDAIKNLEFHSKVLLWRVYSEGEYRVESGKCMPDICEMLDELNGEEYVETETVDFGVTAYRVTDETGHLISNNEDLFRNAREKSEADLICRLF